MLLSAVLVGLGVCSVEAGVSVVDGPTCVVVPTRPTIVQFCFDILKLRRGIYLVAQDKEIGGNATVLHVWDDASQDWIRIGVEEYVAGTVFTQKPKRLIVIGGEADVPEEIATAPAWSEQAYQIETLDLVSVMNKLQVIFKFNEREWKWIAKRYNMTFEDLNAERRRYGRYGKPGEDEKTVMPGAVQEKPVVTLPEGPIEIITAPELEKTEPTAPAPEAQPAAPVEGAKKPKADIPPEDK